MRIEFQNVDEVCKSLPEVTSNKLYSRRDFHEEGLFSQKIFGPVKNYTCACGNYMSRAKKGTVCSICDVEIAHSSERRKRYAKIRLPLAVMNPIMYYLIIKIGKITLKDVLDKLMYSETIIGTYWSEEIKKFVMVDEEKLATMPEGVTLYSGLKGIYDIVLNRANERKDEEEDWQYIYDNMSKFFMQYVIVCPPAFRPISKTKDVQKRDQLNDYILTILNFALTKNDELLESDQDPKILAVNTRNLQRFVFQLYDFILDKFSKKTGIIRDSILGKRNDFSGRAVITPDPSLKIDECRVPYIMLLELYKLELANYLHAKRKFKTYDMALSHIDDCIKKEDFCLWEAVCKVCTGKSVTLNRQPTLHRMGVLGFKIFPNKEYVIQIPPMACEPFNADFDGDQMAIYRALSKAAEKECVEKLSLSQNLISPSTGDLIIGVNQDIVLGIYLLTLDGETPPAEYNGIMTTEGRIKFFNTLPDVYIKQLLSEKGLKLFNRAITKKLLTVILNDVARIYPIEVRECLDKVKQLGFKQTTIHGSTISLKGMHLPKAVELASKIYENTEMTINDKINALKSKEMMDEVKSHFGYSAFIESGSRGSWDQATQIILTRGYVSNSSGDIIQEPIKNNYVHGLNEEEFFNSSYGTRKGLLDTALNTGVSGYLTRKIVYSSSKLEIDESVDNCGTKDTLNFKVISQKMARSLVGRYDVIDGKLVLITLANYMSYYDVKTDEGKTVHLRSPIFCKSRKLCKTCYGKLYEITKSRYIGIIAGQALGEVGTQLVMRTFHTSGVAQTTTKATGGKQEDIVSDLTSVRNLLHCNTKCSYDGLVLDLYRIYSKHRNLLMVHFECVVSQMMRCKNELWRLMPERDDINPELISILSVPDRESWLLALAFHKPRDYIIEGILRPGKQNGILEKIMTNQPLK
jgi:DNA-directed RNA polymerase beta' subunit